MKKIILILVIFITTLSCSQKEEYVDLTPRSYEHSVQEVDLLNKINTLRDSLGLGQVYLVEHISFKCYEHNLYMCDKNAISHDYFYDRWINLERVCDATRIGEIVAYNYNTNQSVLEAWKNSPCHDTIVKGYYTRIGISILTNPDNRKYYTVIFID